MLPVPPKLKFYGNQYAAKYFTGFALSQLEILKRQMSFQGLKQGIRRISPFTGVTIECISKFGTHTINVFVAPYKLSPTVLRKPIFNALPKCYIKKDTSPPGIYLVVGSHVIRIEVIIPESGFPSVSLEEILDIAHIRPEPLTWTSLHTTQIRYANIGVGSLFKYCAYSAQPLINIQYQTYELLNETGFPEKYAGGDASIDTTNQLMYTIDSGVCNKYSLVGGVAVELLITSIPDWQDNWRPQGKYLVTESGKTYYAKHDSYSYDGLCSDGRNVITAHNDENHYYCKRGFCNSTPLKVVKEFDIDTSESILSGMPVGFQLLDDAFSPVYGSKSIWGTANGPFLLFSEEIHTGINTSTWHESSCVIDHPRIITDYVAPIETGPLSSNYNAVNVVGFDARIIQSSSTTACFNPIYNYYEYGLYTSNTSNIDGIVYAQLRGAVPVVTYYGTSIHTTYDNTHLESPMYYHSGGYYSSCGDQSILEDISPLDASLIFNNCVDEIISYDGPIPSKGNDTHQRITICPRQQVIYGPEIVNRVYDTIGSFVSTDTVSGLSFFGIKYTTLSNFNLGISTSNPLKFDSRIWVKSRETMFVDITNNIRQQVVNTLLIEAYEGTDNPEQYATDEFNSTLKLIYFYGISTEIQVCKTTG